MINFNTSPYNDDFDPGKNFHRILFKPGVGVQARELTQSQTILQNQISNFASSIFSQNTPVSGGHVTTNLNCYYIKLNSIAPNGTSITAANFLNQIIQDVTGTILAKVVATVETTTSGTTVGDPPTLIVTYLSGTHFSDNAVITTTSGSIYSATVITSTTNNPSTGLSSVASISTGVFYIVNGYSVSEVTGETYSIGNFVQVNPQTIVLDKYDNTPSYRVGLQISEQSYSSINDSSLLDPALGSSNYQAPGADRYVINLSLISMPIALGNDSNFIELVRIVNGSIIKQVDNTVYSTIDDYFAIRDYETNGDYIVNPFSVNPSANSSGITSEYDLSIGKGVAYVRGYRVENQSQIKLTNNRAQTTANLNNNNVYVDYGNYYTVDTANGVFDVTTLPSVDFHCVGAASVASANANTYNSTRVASGYMRNFTYVNGTGSNTQTYIYNAFVSDLAFNALVGSVTANTSTANSFVINDTTSSFSTVTSAYTGVTLFMTTNGVTDSRKVVSYNGATKTINVDSNFTITPTVNSVFSLTFQSTDVESIIKTATGGYTKIANANISLVGKQNNISTGQALLFNSGSPELIFPVGFPYVAQITNSSYYSQRVYRSKTFSGNVLTLQATSGNSSSPLRFEGSGTLSGQSAEQLFIVIDNSTGNILDFTTSGNTVTISTDKTTATFNSATYANKNVTITAQVQVSSGDSTSYVLKSKNLITGNTTNSTGAFTQVGTTGTYLNLAQCQVIIPNYSVVSTGASLYVTDVKSISAIYDLGTTSTSISGNINYSNISNYYTLNNGQKDSIYDFASIKPVPGAPNPVGNLLVIFNYYSHTQASSGDGYFSIQSYQSASSPFGGVSTSPEYYAQIPTYTAKDGNVYKLSDCIDFRPSRVNGQSTFSLEYSQTQSSTNDIGILIPQNLTNFSSYYQYYLGRMDKLVLTKDAAFEIIQGTPAVNPSLPVEPTSSLVIANLIHDPYTAYVPGEGSASTQPNLSVNKIIHKRWTKSDITDLETRVSNLEYYTSLSALEQSAQSLQVPDVNGLNRFKNGILVDNFSSYSTADTNNPDYAATINIRNGVLTPIQIVDNFQLQNPVVLTGLGTVTQTNQYAINSINGAQTNIFTLPYTTANAVVQQLASSTVSANPFSVVVQQGVLRLNPPLDNWVDTSQAPTVTSSSPAIQVNQSTSGVNLTNSGDFQTLVGTSTSSLTSSVASSYGIAISYTQNTQQTYTSQLQNSSSSTTSLLSSVNGYLTNTAVLPYIRPQQIIIRASGLLVNTPIHTYFDGVDVSQYMINPNTIELNSVTGSFNVDDIVGFYDTTSSNFYPVSRVISVYNYTNTSNTRLYVANILGAPSTIDQTTLTNATYDVNGNYILNSATASGKVTSNYIVNINTTGDVVGIGGGFYISGNTSLTGNLVSAPNNSAYCSFLNAHGVWGDSNQSASYVAAFPFTATVTGTYTVIASADDYAVATVTNSSSTVLMTLNVGSSSVKGYTTTFSGTVALTAGQVYTINWTATNTGGPSAFGLTISDPTSLVVFDTLNPPTLTFNNPNSAITVPGGSMWYTGVTQVNLGPNAANTAGYYVGSTINITSKYVYNVSVPSTYTPPAAAPSGSAGSSIFGGNSSNGVGPLSSFLGIGIGGGSCCVVATALTANGEWSNKQRMSLVDWSVNKLDKNFFGDRLHRGYHIIAPKTLVLMANSKNKYLKRYAKWTFENATNMLMKKSFKYTSIPNTLIWTSLMLTVGMFVSKKDAEISWQNIYKNKK